MSRSDVLWAAVLVAVVAAMLVAVNVYGGRCHRAGGVWFPREWKCMRGEEIRL